MAYNWNPYTGDDDLLQNGQLCRPSSRAASNPATAARSRTQSTSTTGNDFSPLEVEPAPETYFSDAYFGNNDEFLLGDVELNSLFGNMNPGAGSTSESSPEPVSAVEPTRDHTTFANQAISRQQRRISEALSNTTPSSSRSPGNSPASSLPTSAPSYSNPSPLFDSLSPNSVVSSLLDDPTFSNMSNTASTGNPLETVQEDAETDLTSNITSKRQRATGHSDIIAACWTSPLCPNHTKEGTPPDPSNCGGACAPYLFAEQPAVQDFGLDQDVLNSNLTATEISDIVTEPRARLKRSESESSGNIPAGRVFARPSDLLVKHESSTSPEHLALSKGSPTTTEEDSGNPAQSQNQPQQTKGAGSRRRLPHNQVERKYRESLNTQLDNLRRVVPSLSTPSPNISDGADIEDLPAPSKPSKAVILASATAYIKQMEREKQQILNENEMLRTRVRALQALVKCEDCSLMKYVMDLKIAPQG